MRLVPLNSAPEPGYPAWDVLEEPKRSALRRAAATATVSLALCFAGCSDESPGVARDAAAAADSGHDADHDHDHDHGEPPVVLREQRAMTGKGLGMPLSLSLDEVGDAGGDAGGERMAGTAGPGMPAAPGSLSPGKPEEASSDPRLVINLDPTDMNTPDQVARPRPRPRPVRMSGCSRMSGR